MVSVLAAPATFEWSRWLDWLASLPDARARRTHLLVERWALDEMPLARQLFEEVVELLYRENRFMRGSLLVGGQRAAAESVEAPLLSVMDARCQVVPPKSILPFLHAVRSAETLSLWYTRETGVAVQHVGMLAGQGAHRHLWPEILRWIHAHG
jgi:polyhydroxyalkanoate synthase